MIDVPRDALSTLAEWLPGYTDPIVDPQSRVSLIADDGDSLVVEYEHPAHSGARHRYRLSVTVTPEETP